MVKYLLDDWLKALLAELPDGKISQAVSDDNALWINIEDNVSQLGSLTHSQIDIAEIRRQALTLLETESKDFRVMVHLLRTLQHGGNAEELLLAAKLLVQYVQYYWQQAWPKNQAHKIRFAQQVIKRFETAAVNFSRGANETQRSAMPGELAFLAKLWRDNGYPTLAESADALFTLYQRDMRELSVSPTDSVVPELAAERPLISSVAVAVQQNAPTISVENHDEKSWRETLLKVAGILCERQPDNPLGYRLRRHAIWQNISAAPQTENDGRTPMAAFSSDIMADYLARESSSDSALWQQVEQSLILAPYWFDGHALSARIAKGYGYHDVAEAIKDEVNHFLQRIPALNTLLFSDRTPFLSTSTKRWLAPYKTTLSTETTDLTDETRLSRQHLHEQGLEATLRYLNELPEGEPRDRFYRQYIAAQMIEEAGMVQLAKQHYRTLLNTGSHMSLSDWEPALLARLEEKITSAQ
ncbi:type VI secretion system protein TssA [Salmonella enterica]|nr:type VI secretion system protein TssA [Salmonella enterica subsp. enterica]ELX7028088.1 type VI secretion system protein TssA [Salmonella enterica]MLP09045.1 type VI secretion system protein TssA [Salmonella enterica subsp. enterica serovar Kedougou]ECJ4522077.1 type VI secretion system protein TssA [Salmonella enterica subsp. enterica]EMA0079662.1 type VI secretion system protein TssA [Salmonella enterica]